MDRVELRHTIARLLGDMVVKGTATSGTTTTIVDTANLIHSEDDILNGYEVYVNEGTNVGSSRIITDFVASSDTITFPAMGSANDTTSKYEIHRKHRIADYERAINMAYETARMAIGRDKFNFYIPKVDETLIINDIMMGDGQFERWANGTSSAPSGWTVDSNSTIARESTIVNKGSYSAKLTSDGTNEGYLQWQLNKYIKYAGDKFTLKADCNTDTASRVRMRIQDGVTTTNDDYHTGGGGFEELEITNFTLDDAPTELTVQLRIEAGSAVTAYWNNVRLIAKRGFYEYELPLYPSPFATISEIWIESGGSIQSHLDSKEDLYDFKVPSHQWDIQVSATPKLVFDPNYFALNVDWRI